MNLLEMDRVDLSDEKIKQTVKFSDEGEIWVKNSPPKIEVDLQELQTEYYDPKTKPLRKQQVFSEMFGLITKYARSLFLKKLKGGSYVEPDVVEDKAIQAALSFMSQYVNRPGFRVGASFGGMLEFKVREARFKEYVDEHHLSLNTIVGDEDGNELEDIQEKVGFKDVFNQNSKTIEEKLFSTTLTDTIRSTLEDFDAGVNGDPRFELASRMWLAILLRKPKNKHGKGQFLRVWGADPKVKRTLNYLELVLYDRLKQGVATSAR